VKPRYSAQTRDVLARAMAPADREVFLAANAPMDPQRRAVGREASGHGALAYWNRTFTTATGTRKTASLPCTLISA
jgi:hypothetical protein